MSTRKPGRSTVRAARLHRAALVVDGHADTIQWALLEGTDITQSMKGTHCDLPRWRAGGVDIQFFSVWVDPMFTGQAAVRRTLTMIDLVHEAAARSEGERRRPGSRLPGRSGTEWRPQDMSSSSSIVRRGLPFSFCSAARSARVLDRPPRVPTIRLKVKSMKRSLKPARKATTHMALWVPRLSAATSGTRKLAIRK